MSKHSRLVVIAVALVLLTGCGGVGLAPDESHLLVDRLKRANIEILGEERIDWRGAGKVSTAMRYDVRLSGEPAQVVHLRYASVADRDEGRPALDAVIEWKARHTVVQVGTLSLAVILTDADAMRNRIAAALAN